MTMRFTTLALALALGCSSSEEASNAVGDAEVDSTLDSTVAADTSPSGDDVAADAVLDTGSGDGSSEVMPPGPPPSLDDLADALAPLPKDEAGLPILLSTTATLPPGTRMDLVVDLKREDAVTAWAGCVSRVIACKRANPKGPIAGCIDLIETCPATSGSKLCCPTACIGEFKAAVASGASDWDAVDKSFLRGTCVPGFPVFDGGAL